MSSNCFNKNPPTFDEISIEFWNSEVLTDLFLTIENIVAGTAVVSKKILSEKCLQWIIKLSSNSPRIILQYQLKCDENETFETIPVKDFQIMDDSSETVDDKNITSQENIIPFDEAEETPFSVQNFKQEIPVFLSIHDDNEEIKNKIVEENQTVATSCEININTRSLAELAKNVNGVSSFSETESSVISAYDSKMAPFQIEHGGNCDDGRKNKISEEIGSNNGINTFEKVCKECGKCFTKTDHLIVHRRIHTGEKPFKCEDCGKCFTQAIHLTIHMRIHTGERPFKCGTCDKSFTHSNALVLHTRIHTGEKPFKCEVCSKCFTQESHLIAHQRVHTGEKPFTCDVCGKSFTHSSNLNRHKKLHNGENPLITKKMTNVLSFR